MRIMYVSCHSILEYDECQLLTDLGHDVFSVGAYLDPRGHPSLPRPGIKGMTHYPEMEALARLHPHTKLPKELIDWAEVVIIMHSPDVVLQNFEAIKHLPVVWRTIGQSTAKVEAMMKPLVDKGLKIARYSPKERGFPNFAGEDVLLRFCKDEDVFTGWTGETHDVVTFVQSLKGRRRFCHYDTIIEVIGLFDNAKIYGSGNDDLGVLNGGEVPFTRQLEIMRQSRVLLYAGTWPASYTLSFVEALMVGLPIVSVSKTLAHIPGLETLDFFECDELLAQVGGAVADSASGMAIATQRFRVNDEQALEVSQAQRKLACELFGRKVLLPQWESFLGSL